MNWMDTRLRHQTRRKQYIVKISTDDIKINFDNLESVEQIGQENKYLKGGKYETLNILYSIFPPTKRIRNEDNYLKKILLLNSVKLSKQFQSSFLFNVKPFLI